MGRASPRQCGSCHPLRQRGPCHTLSLCFPSSLPYQPVKKHREGPAGRCDRLENGHRPKPVPQRPGDVFQQPVMGAARKAEVHPTKSPVTRHERFLTLDTAARRPGWRACLRQRSSGYEFQWFARGGRGPGRRVVIRTRGLTGCAINRAGNSSCLGVHEPDALAGGVAACFDMAALDA